MCGTALSFRLHSRTHHFYIGTVLRESSCSEWHRLKGWSSRLSIQATEKMFYGLGWTWTLRGNLRQQDTLLPACWCVLSHCGYRLLPAVVFQLFKGHFPGVPGGWWQPRASQYLPRTSCLLLHILCSSTPMTHHWLIDNMTIWSDSLGLLHSHIALSAWALSLMTQLLQTQLEEKFTEEKCFI